MSRGFHPFKGRVSRHFGENLAPEDAYLSYYDVRLTKEDMDCIKDDWLTDNAIAFYEEYLEHETLQNYPKSNIVLLRPSMCFMLVLTPDPTSLKEALPSFTGTTHIFLPVNDSRSPNVAEGGSHWSLLVVSVTDGVSFHYDSLNPSNRQSAKQASDKLSVLLGRPLRFLDLEDSPQQENGSDCGVYVCAIMRFLLKHKLLMHDANRQVSMSMAGVRIDASRERKDIIRLIDGFRREGRSRSRSRSPMPGNEGKGKSPPRVGD